MKERVIVMSDNLYQKDIAGHLCAYIVSPSYKDNTFLNQIPTKENIPSFEQVRKFLPEPIFEASETAIQAYWKAWEIAFGNLKEITDKNKFINNYINMKFNGNIFLWDTVFMVMFGQYGRRAFDFQGSLNNFYAKQHPDGFICREISEESGQDLFHRHDVSSTGPNLFAWSEWSYYKMSGDKSRLNRVFPVILSYHKWFSKYRTWQDGTCFSSGWGCGMDNQPRTKENEQHEFQHGHMSWIDITCQHVLSARMLSDMADELGDNDISDSLTAEADSLAEKINCFMWNEELGFYCDKYKEGTVSDVMTIGGFWALLSKCAVGERLDRMVAALFNPTKFKSAYMVPTMAISSKEYNPKGGYWRGSVWPPTNYMVLKGLEENGFFQEAYEIAKNHHEEILEVFQKTNTFYENYSPSLPEKGSLSTGEFIGWTGVSAINVFIEFIIGIKVHAKENRISWIIHHDNMHGIRNLPFLDDGLIDLVFQPNYHENPKETIEVVSNKNFVLEINKGKKCYEFTVNANEKNFFVLD